jgi:hypothetical protein
VDAVRAVVDRPFGVGGLTLPGGGFPISSDLLAAEVVRTGADFTFLRRAFTADMAGRDPFVEVPRLLASVDRYRRADLASVAADRAAFVAAVGGTPAPALVAVGPAA